MTARSLLLGLFAVGCLACSGWMPEMEAPADERTPVEAPTEDVVATVRAVYAAYEAGTPPGLTELPLSAGLAAAWEAGRADLGYDPVIDGQDFDLSDVAVSSEGDVVVVRFSNFGSATEVRWTMVVEGGRWVAADLTGPSGSLRGRLDP